MRPLPGREAADAGDARRLAPHLPRRRRHRAGADTAVPGALWRLDHVDLRSLDRYEGAPHLYERRLLEVDTESGPLEAITYVMTSDDYLGLPSTWYFERIVEGYADWGLPRDALSASLRATREELAGRGVTEFHPDGRKRLRGLAD